MSLENFREINLYEKTLYNSYQNCNNTFIYPIHNYYFGCNDNIISIYNENLELIVMNDTLIRNNYNNIYISLFNQRLVIQYIYNNQSIISIFNNNFTNFGKESMIELNKQIIYIWNNEPIYIEYKNQCFNIYSIENTLYYQYKLQFNIQGYSNIICFNKDIYLLAKLDYDYYVYIKLGDKLEHSNYFRLDYDDIRHLSIDYYQDIFHIIIMKNDNSLISIKKHSLDIFVHFSEKQVYSSISNFILHSNNTLLIKNKWADEIVFDFNNIPKYIPRIFKSLDIEPTMTRETSKIIYIQSSKYFDYFKWIVENYDTSENETVIFYKNVEYNINIQFVDNFIIHTLNMENMSNPMKIFMFTMGKLILSDGSIYKRSFKKTNIVQNIMIHMISNENSNDFYIKNGEISEYDLKKILYFLIINNIKYINQLFWTPFQYFKLDMKLIWNRSKDYWEKIYNVLNKDENFENYMPYLFYNIING